MKLKRHSRRHPKSVMERIWVVLLVLGFVATGVMIVFYYSGPEIFKWVGGLSEKER
jgi:drug/metabolite transporter (DMT)-like permease